MPPSDPSLGSIARRNWWLVALCAIVLALAGLGVGLTRDPTYTATLQLNVGTLDARAQAVPGYVEAAKSLASSYSRVATTDRVVAPVAAAVGLTPEEVRERITVTPVIQNPIVTIEAEGPSEEAARTLSRTTAETLIAEVARLDRESGSDEALLDEFRTASRRLASAELRLRRLRRERDEDADAVPREEINRQQAEVETRRLESQTIGNLYAETRERAGAAASLELVGAPAVIEDDRGSTAQQLAFVGFVAGIAVGLALAALRHAVTVARLRRRPRVAA